MRKNEANIDFKEIILKSINSTTEQHIPKLLQGKLLLYTIDKGIKEISTYLVLNQDNNLHFSKQF